MTEYAGPPPAPVDRHDPRPVLRLVGGTDAEPAGAGPDEQARRRSAAARAAHPSSGSGVPQSRHLRSVPPDGPG